MDQGRSYSMKKVGGKVDSPGEQGDKGIPPGIKKGDGFSGKGVHSPTTQGDKGIPPKSNPSAKPPKD